MLPFEVGVLERMDLMDNGLTVWEAEMDALEELGVDAYPDSLQ